VPRSVPYFQQPPPTHLAHFNPQPGPFYDYTPSQPPPPAYQPKFPAHYTNRPKFNQPKKKTHQQPLERPTSLIPDMPKATFARITDKDWPSLATATSQSEKPEPISSTSESSSDNEDQGNIKTESIPEIKPTVVDASTLEKLMKNVNLIKKTVEQHYLSQTLSFKDVVLKKPEVAAPVLDVAQDTIRPVESKSKKRDERRKRSRSRHKAAVEDNAQAEQEESSDVRFNLDVADFPSLDEPSDRDNRNRTNTEVVKARTEGTSQTSGRDEGKKVNRPIIVEFANMISALEKGQKQLQHGKKQHHMSAGSRLNDGGFVDAKPARSKSAAGLGKINQLDSCQVVARGKEREKPRQKKHSTLKKVCCCCFD